MCIQFDMLTCFLDLLQFGSLVVLAFFQRLSLLMTFVSGRFQLEFWSSWLPFLSTLHWPASGADLGVDGVSYVELLLLMSSGLVRGFSLRKLFLVAAGSPNFSVGCSALIFGCRVGFLEGCFGLLGALPGGLRRFVPCGIGANHCKLRHFGWEKSGQGITCRPRETSSVPFLDEMLVLFGYLPSLGLRCATKFACKVPTWRHPVGGVSMAFLLRKCSWFWQPCFRWLFRWVGWLQAFRWWI